MLELRGITKTFGAIKANAGVHLQVARASIHGVIGENGAGKSTAMKILYGIYPPDAGEIWIEGKKRNWSSPLDAIEAGIGMVHQHFMLAGPFSALDNILLGAETAHPRYRFLPFLIRPMDRKVALQKLIPLAKQYGLEVPWEEKVENLPVGIQQRIEIIKILYRDARILILDEPTAVLTPQESEALFENLKHLKNEGKTILIITHKLREVLNHTDRVTVFRKGEVTGEFKTKETSVEQLAKLMVGRNVNLRITPPPPAPSISPPQSILSVRDLSLGKKKKKLSNVSFDVHSSEIVGIAGVEGNGQSELLKAILHPNDSRFRSKGEIQILGKPVTPFKTKDIKSLGMGVIPEDRQEEGLLLAASLRENFLLGFQGRPLFKKWGFVTSKNLSHATLQALETYDVRPLDLTVSAGSLSGGNQQKLIIAREFQTSPRFLIFSQPTRGVDVGATELIYERMLRARTEGAGILLISSELEEITSLADRILVLYEGSIVAEFKRGECDEKTLGIFMSGAGKRARHA